MLKRVQILNPAVRKLKLRRLESSVLKEHGSIKPVEHSISSESIQRVFLGVYLIGVGIYVKNNIDRMFEEEEEDIREFKEILPSIADHMDRSFTHAEESMSRRLDHMEEFMSGRLDCMHRDLARFTDPDLPRWNRKVIPFYLQR